MTIKTILTPLDGSEATANALETALVVARRFDGHIDGLHVQRRAAEAAPFIGDYLSKGVRDSVLEAAASAAGEQAAKVHAQFERFCKANKITEKSSVSASWIDVTGDVAEEIVRRGRLSDAIVVPRPEKRADRIRRSPAGQNLQAMLLRCGRPVVLVPPGWQARRTEHAAIGWNESLEASRALAMTIPWLEQMKTVSVVISRKREASVDEVLAYLERHGVEARVCFLDDAGGSVGEAMLTICADEGVDFLVVGGYSHARARQLLFGGVTQHLINNTSIVTVLVH